MGNFRILKDKQTNHTEGKLWDVFELDSFHLKSGLVVVIKPEEIFTIIDKFKFYTKIPESALISELTHYIFQSLGGSKDTPVQEVLAFSYTLFASPNLRLPEMFLSFTHAIHFNTCLSYLLENDVPTPNQYLSAIYELVKNRTTFDLVLSRYQDLLLVEMEDDAYSKWLEDLPNKVDDYIKGVNATKNLF